MYGRSFGALGWLLTATPLVQAPAAGDGPVLRVCGIDASGSAWELVRVGMATCAGEIADASPGDRVVVRWITGRSLATRAEILTVTLPALPPKCPNVYAVACHNRLVGAQEADRRLRRRAIDYLMSQKPVRSGATDIMGFLQAAADVTEGNAGKFPKRILTIASDLRDNVADPMIGKLAGVDVRLVQLQPSADAVGPSLRARKGWIRFFEAAGAKVRLGIPRGGDDQ